jgi:lipoate-protein ligase A
VHRAVSDWLKERGIETVCQPQAGKIIREGAPAGMLCFLHPAAGDVLFQGCKVMGSAQRKRHGAILQHGSLLLGTCPAAPWLPGLANLGAPTAGIVADGLAACLEIALGSKAGHVSWGDEAEFQIREVATSRYLNSEWNESR